MANVISNSEDIIDSRDVIACVDELESDISAWQDDLNDHQIEITDKEDEIEELENRSQELDDDDDDDEIAEIENLVDNLNSEISDIEGNITTIEFDISEAQEELNPLKSLAEDCEGYAADWNYGEALIRDSYFEDYARQLAEDIGSISNNLWPACHIDWTAAAEALQMDYTSVDFDGVEYWIR